MSLWEYFTFGNFAFTFGFLLILNQLIELYQFRNMPPGPRLTILPFVGNLCGLDSIAPGESLDATTRFVVTLSNFCFVLAGYRTLLSFILV